MGSAAPATLLRTAMGAAAAGVLFAAATARLSSPARCAVDLPQDRWLDHDLTMLQGCWHRRTLLQTRALDGGNIREVAGWIFCFDKKGAGRQTVIWTNGDSCSSAAEASFHTDDMLEVDTQVCQSSGYKLLPLSLACRWRDAKRADCPEYLAGFRPIPAWPNGFHPGLFER